MFFFEYYLWSALNFCRAYLRMMWDFLGTVSYFRVLYYNWFRLFFPVYPSVILYDVLSKFVSSPTLSIVLLWCPCYGVITSSNLMILLRAFWSISSSLFCSLTSFPWSSFYTSMFPIIFLYIRTGKFTVSESLFVGSRSLLVLTGPIGVLFLLGSVISVALHAVPIFLSRISAIVDLMYLLLQLENFTFFSLN